MIDRLGRINPDAGGLAPILSLDVPLVGGVARDVAALAVDVVDEHIDDAQRLAVVPAVALLHRTAEHLDDRMLGRGELPGDFGNGAVGNVADRFALGQGMLLGPFLEQPEHGLVFLAVNYGGGIKISQTGRFLEHGGLAVEQHHIIALAKPGILAAQEGLGLSGADQISHVGPGPVSPFLGDLFVGQGKIFFLVAVIGQDPLNHAQQEIGIRGRFERHPFTDPVMGSLGRGVGKTRVHHHMLEFLGIGADPFRELLQVAGSGLHRIIRLGNIGSHADQVVAVFVITVIAYFIGRQIQRCLNNTVEGAGTAAAMVEHMRHPSRIEHEARGERCLLVAAVGPDELIALRAPTLGRRLVHEVRVFRAERLVVAQDGLEALHLSVSFTRHILEEQPAVADFLDRLIPREDLPFAGTPRPHTFHGVLQPKGAVEGENSGLPFGTE